MEKNSNTKAAAAQPNLFSILKPYKAYLAVLTLVVLAANGITLWVPKIISKSIDGYFRRTMTLHTIIWEFSLAAFFIFVFTYLQSILQTYLSEKVAKDVRKDLSIKIADHSHTFIGKITPARLLTNLTSDVDSIKMFVAQAIVTIISSVFIIIVGSILLITTNWKLGLAVLIILPIIGGTFFLVLSKVRVLFTKRAGVTDWLNKVINESILGAALIRVLHSQKPEYDKFLEANTSQRDLGITILKLFSAMIPVVTFASNLAILIILVLGGHFVIAGSMSLGDFAAFNNYLVILIFPIFILGFMSNIIAQAQASYTRVAEVLLAPKEESVGTIVRELTGDIKVADVTLTYGEKYALKNVSFEVKPRTRTAIIGPTAGGKTQLLYLLIGLMDPTKGKVLYDNKNINEYQEESFYRQVGFVFQDSIMFNMTLRENIAFNTSVTEEDLNRAIDTAELGDFIKTLPNGLETVVSERGTSLSGGQKQRVMLARALALNPKVLLLDDFTARVDTQTEKKILSNVLANYPELTLLSVTQKIASVEDYDQIILLMEGEVLAKGTHEELLATTPEYAQIYDSQQSTNQYEHKNEL
jgi:ATP-binding cassette subfamily B protein